MGVIKYGKVAFRYGEGKHYYGELESIDLTEYKRGSFYGNVFLAFSYKAGYRGVYIPVVFPLQGKAYKIIFYDRTGLKIGEISSETEKSPLINATFELLTLGCGAFDISLSELPEYLKDITYNYRVDIHLFGNGNPWYSGYITDLPQEGTTELAWKYSGYGFYNQLEDVLVERVYEGREVAYIVNDLMSTLIEAATDIVYSVDKIKATAYEVQSIRWDRVSSKEVMKELAEMVLGYEFGVDEDREFFFRPKDTSINEDTRFWVGKHLTVFIPKADISKIKNKLHIYSGKVTGAAGEKTNYVLTVEDVPEGENPKEDKLTLPSALDDADAGQWGNYKLTESKDPVQTAKVKGVEVFKTKIEPIGKAKITSIDGLHTYELPIKQVEDNYG
ncbi:hypothetical protein ES708_10282 [subsurface metagenome]